MDVKSLNQWPKFFRVKPTRLVYIVLTEELLPFWKVRNTTLFGILTGWEAVGGVKLGVNITGRIAVVTPTNKHSQNYLATKQSRMGHSYEKGSPLAPLSPSKAPQSVIPVASGNTNSPNAEVKSDSIDSEGLSLHRHADWSDVLDLISAQSPPTSGGGKVTNLITSRSIATRVQPVQVTSLD